LKLDDPKTQGNSLVPPEFPNSAAHSRTEHINR